MYLKINCGKILTVFISLVFVFLILIALPSPALAHERWFVENPNSYQLDFNLIFSWQVGFTLLFGGSVTLAAWFLAQRYRIWHRNRNPNPNQENVLAGISEKRLRRVYSYLPLLLAVHTAVPLLVNGFQLQLFAPNLKMEPNLLSGLVSLAEVMIALALVYGVFTEYAAVGLVVLYGLSFILSPFLHIPAILLPEQCHYIGIALFLFIMGRGPFSADALLGRRAHPDPRLVTFALPILRWSVGLSIIILAFTEKLLNPLLGQAFLGQKINFNLGSSLGFTNELFIFIAGIIEFTFGCLLISGAFPRLIIISLWIPFNLTLPYLGWIELAGHLPIYAVMLILLIVGPGSRRLARRSALILAQEAGVLDREEGAEKVNVSTAGLVAALPPQVQ